MKYKVGDKVRIKSEDWYNRYINGKEGDCGTCPFTFEMKIFCGQVLTIKWVHQNWYYMVEDNSKYFWTDEMIEGLVEEETIHNKWTGLKVELELSKTVIGVSNVESINGERFMSGFVKAIIPPEDCQFVDENGNVINATKIVLEKKKKEYPKTYEECEQVLRYDSHRLDNMGVTVRGYKWELIRVFQILLICRDAYWKLYGEEMGLDGPWEPTTEVVFCISRINNRIELLYKSGKSDILEFPTPEMRDAFHENFKEKIKFCKEFL